MSVFSVFYLEIYILIKMPERPFKYRSFGQLNIPCQGVAVKKDKLQAPQPGPWPFILLFPSQSSLHHEGSQMHICRYSNTYFPALSAVSTNNQLLATSWIQIYQWFCMSSETKVMIVTFEMCLELIVGEFQSLGYCTMI